MSEHDEKIAQLEARLDSLVRTQVDFQVEISSIRKELTRLRNITPGAHTSRSDIPPAVTTRVHEPIPAKPQPAATNKIPEPGARKVPPPEFATSRAEARTAPFDTSRVNEVFTQYTENAKADLEKFIGENLISKVGIVVLLLGIGIGAKYAIDNNLISPLTRIILGYVAGTALLGFAVWLKPRYHNFSSVLMSGGMSVMYFITYFAYATYGLMPQSAAFVLMAMFTAFTVVAALFYNRQIVAHIGLVGAYAVPFLLSDDSGRYLFLFSYIAVLNCGILAISIRKAWKPIFYTASVFTWLIFGTWLATRYVPESHFYLALIFAGVFFAILYATRIIHGVIHQETADHETLISTIATAAVFYLLVIVAATRNLGLTELTLYFAFLAFFALVVLLSSYRFYGRVLVFVVYPITWIAFGLWFISYYDPASHFGITAVFASVFFAVFYGATLVYGLATEELGAAEYAALVLTNSFVYYGFGYAAMDRRADLQSFEGLYTLGHAVLHAVVAQIVGRIREDAVVIVLTLTVLVITFTTLAVPIQLDGNFVTLVWTVEACVLFYFGRARGIRLYEYLSYPVMLLAAGSMTFDWVIVYRDRADGLIELARQPFFNGDLVTGLVFVTGAAFIYVINRQHRESVIEDEALVVHFGRLAAAVALIVLYNAIRMEIGNYFHLQSHARGLSLSPLAAGNYDLRWFNALAQSDLAMLFLIVMAIVNLRKVRWAIVGAANAAGAIGTLAIVATVGMYLHYALRLTYMAGTSVGWLGTSGTNVAARYVTYALAAGLLATLFAYCLSTIFDEYADRGSRTVVFDAVLYPFLLIALSCELMNISAQLHIANAGRYGLSILWGIFALGLVVIGIAQAKKYLRIGSIVLLAFTLAKLFFFDITDLGTIPKTILFVSLGLLLLVISFLYNKYKAVIFGADLEVK